MWLRSFPWNRCLGYGVSDTGGITMAEFYGVNCETCGEFIELGRQRHGKAIAYEVPDEPLRCEHDHRHVLHVRSGGR